MNKHKKSMCQLIVLGIIAGVLLMGVDTYQERQLATAMTPGDQPADNAPVLSNKKMEGLRYRIPPDRILM